MSAVPEPSAHNHWLVDQAARIIASYHFWTGQHLVDPALDPAAAASALYRAPFVVLAHDAAADPVFTYANLTAQRLFERPWREIIGLPSRYSAEPLAREERARLLDQVARQGYTDNYSGVRVTASGRRFRVHRAIVWNLIEADGTLCGQAASFADWEWL